MPLIEMNNRADRRWRPRTIAKRGSSSSCHELRPGAGRGFMQVHESLSQARCSSRDDRCARVVIEIHRGLAARHEYGDLEPVLLGNVANEADLSHNAQLIEKGADCDHPFAALDLVKIRRQAEAGDGSNRSSTVPGRHAG